MQHDESWYQRQEQACLRAIKEAERRHTEQEVADADVLLSTPPTERQSVLFEVES